MRLMRVNARAVTRACRAAMMMTVAVAAPLAAWLRSAAEADPVDDAALRLAWALLERLP